MSVGNIMWLSLTMGFKSHRDGDIAQLGERLPCKQEVAGSSPTISTILPFYAGMLESADRQA